MRPLDCTESIGDARDGAGLSRRRTDLFHGSPTRHHEAVALKSNVEQRCRMLSRLILAMTGERLRRAESRRRLGAPRRDGGPERYHEEPALTPTRIRARPLEILADECAR